jgi:excisionase family DNA binding protein
MDELLTVAETAACLRVSQATLWRWCQEGRVPALKIGREWRVVNPALQRLVEATDPVSGSRDGSTLISSIDSAPTSS